MYCAVLVIMQHVPFIMVVVVLLSWHTILEIFYHYTVLSWLPLCSLMTDKLSDIEQIWKCYTNISLKTQNPN